MLTSNEPDQCWVCDNWMYCVFIWHPEIGMYHQVNLLGIDSQTKKRAVETIRNEYSDVYLKNEEVPVLFTGVNGWRPRPLMRLFDYSDLYEKEVFPRAFFNLVPRGKWFGRSD